MKTIGIIGLGVMGGSFAGRCRQLGHHVIGFDKDEDTLRYAVEHELVDEAATSFRRLKDCDLVIFCLYPTAIVDWLKENQDYFAPGTMLMEISGIKRGIMSQIRQVLRPDVELLSVHPMCGRESRGIQYSDPAIFDGANFLIIPDEHSSPKVCVLAGQFASELGCANISVLTPEQHDRVIGFLSQLTHVIAVSLMNTHENGHLVEYTGDSFRDLTRIAKINEDMWAELFSLNRDILVDEVDQFLASMQQFRSLLLADDKEGMKEKFVQATKRRQAFDRDE